MSQDLNLENEWLDLDGVVASLSQHGANRPTVMRFIDTGRLPICYRFTGEIVGLTVESPQGVAKRVERPIRVSGILRSLDLPSGTVLTSSVVQIAALNSRQFVDGTWLPTTSLYGGLIQPGTVVSGFVDFLAVPQSEWLFDVGDLDALMRDLVEPARSVAVCDSNAPAMSNTPDRWLPKTEIITEFMRIYRDEKWWTSQLRGRNKWVVESLKVKGKRGKGGSEGRFDPVRIALHLRECHRVPLNRLTHAFRTRDRLTRFQDEWDKLAETFPTD